ncbi:glycosyltransferase family 4 protein [Actinocorallia sp. API 0066]|uniref:glycosyltransferase family 4 protein n=1 Tax=Actinocorallia sp. API 0066 TaxID=2896846 RepID=UPI001E56D7D7|nr:glycosyltransferase family 4 protein [Actinocorallia sp. API 0066]MCD0450131.1 glycosyltransferase family 4 protein [Actinocorallia sp. API 0066]
MPSSQTPVRRPVIALVTDAVHPYSRGGREVRYHELGRLLSEHADIHVYTMRWWDGPRTRREDHLTLHAVCRRMPFYRGTRRSVTQAVVFALGCLRLLFRRFDALSVDHIPQFQLFTLRIVATLRRKPLVATWHEVWGPEYWRDYMGGLSGRFAWFVERLSMRVPDHIIAASEQTAARIHELVGDHGQVTVAPNGIDLAAVAVAPPAPETTDFAVVSRLMQHKRLDMLLQAIALLHSRGHRVTCRIIGDGPERRALAAMAAELGVAHAVEFRHDVTEQKDLYSLLKAGRVFPFPSNREGFGIAVLEALACGLPVVTTTAPDNLAVHLVARSRDGIVCAHETEALAEALLTALRERRDDGWIEPWLGEYTWEAVADQVGKVLLT